MKIAVVLDAFPKRSELFIYRELIALKALGHEIDLFAVTGSAEACPGEAEGLKSSVSVVPRSPAGLYGARFLRELFVPPWPGLRLRAAAARRIGQAKELAAMLDAAQVDAIHAHFAAIPGIVAAAAAEILGRFFTVSIHARDLFAANPLLRMIVERAAGVAACSEYACEILRAKFPARGERFEAIRHTFPRDFPVLPRRARAKPLVLAVGRFIEKKGFEHLIDAAAMLRDSGVEFDLALVGDGPLAGTLRRRAQTRSLSSGGAGVFPGWLRGEEVRAMLAEASILAAPSVIARDGDRDNIPNVVLEAFAAGVPVVASRVAGIPEAVVDGRSGLLVAPGDPKGLADAAGSILADEKLAKRLAEGGREILGERFDNAAKLERFIAERSK